MWCFQHRVVSLNAMGVSRVFWDWMHFGGDMKPFRIRVMYCLSERALFMKELFPLK